MAPSGARGGAGCDCAGGVKGLVAGYDDRDDDSCVQV